MIGLTRRQLVWIAGISALCPTTPSASTEPVGRDGPIRVIVPRTPGGAVDVVGRGWSEGIHRQGGQSYVENIGGGGGRIGASVVAHAPADGHTLLIGSTSEIVLGPLVENQQDNPAASLTPIAILSTSPLAFCVDPSLPIHDLRSLIAYARANPDKANYGSAGTGTLGHVEGELLKQTAQLPSLTHVPYRGGSDAILDVIGGRVAFAIVSISAGIVQMHRAGKLRVVATTSAQRSTAAPDLADVAEQGYPALVTEFFIGLFAPAGVPNAVLDALAGETRVAMQDPSLQANLLKAGFTVPETNRAAAEAYVQHEQARWKAVLSGSGIASK